MDVDALDRKRMDKLTAGLPSKSAKMRRLAAAGYERADIARYLGVRYQFVYNVLSAPRVSDERGKPMQKEASADKCSPVEKSDNGSPDPKWAWVEIERGGRIELPGTFLEALGVGEGDQVQLALERDSIRVSTRARALEELRGKVRQFVPEGVSLVDELIAERRAEAAKESKGG